MLPMASAVGRSKNTLGFCLLSSPFSSWQFHLPCSISCSQLVSEVQRNPKFDFPFWFVMGHEWLCRKLRCMTQKVLRTFTIPRKASPPETRNQPSSHQDPSNKTSRIIDVRKNDLLVRPNPLLDREDATQISIRTIEKTEAS